MLQPAPGVWTAWEERSRRSWPLHPGRLLGAAVLCVLLTACGGDGDPAPDPLASFSQQSLDWQVCDPAVVGQEHGAELSQWGGRVQCALMRVPRDYDNPAQGELQIELLRMAAAQPQQRLGAIVFNPGGPGEDGLATALLHGVRLAGARPEDPGGAQLREMSHRYDMIGFSPRGTGASNPLVCDLSEDLQEQDSLTYDRSPQNLHHARHNARVMAQACLNHPLSPYIHTDATARDMDLLRALLGEARLNYIGYSYGTWLGAWYAGLFPERAGRMLLDSSIHIGERLDDQMLQQERADQRILDDIMLPYAARHQDKLALGSAAELRNALLALPASLKEALFSLIDFRDSGGIDRGMLSMSAAVGLNTLMQAHPAASAEEMHALIEAHDFTPVPRLNLVAAQQAMKLAGALEEDDNDLQDEDWMRMNAHGTMQLLPEFTVNMAVRCNDTGSMGDALYWEGISNDYAARYPFFGGNAASKPCLSWPASARKMPVQAAGKAGPLLMLQSRYDGATPFEGALGTLDALPNARMIMIEDEYTHGLFPYGTACVDGQVADYFLHGTLPARTSSCAGKPLSGDRAVTAGLGG